MNPDLGPRNGNSAMRICIPRGTKEIGGTCVEIESRSTRIVLDVGLPLDVTTPDEIPLHPIRGFETLDASLLGVIISHPHQDHYGLTYRLPGQTLFLIGKAAQSILAAANLLTPGGTAFENVRYLENRKPITLGSFTIVPFLVDHSAYDAYGILVEADGKRLFYSGDLRARPQERSSRSSFVNHRTAWMCCLWRERPSVVRTKCFPQRQLWSNDSWSCFSRRRECHWSGVPARTSTGS
jgi:ribonuclease J